MAEGAVSQVLDICGEPVFYSKGITKTMAA